MNRFIVFTVVLVAIWGAGAEPPQFRTFKYVHPAQPAVQSQFGQQQAVASGYEPAGAPAGQLLLLPGEYVVQVNQPLREYGVPEQQAQFVPQPGAVEQYNYQQQHQFAGVQDPNYYNGQQYQGQQFGQYNVQQGQYNGQQGQFNAPGQQTSQAGQQFGQYNAQQRQYNAPSQQSGQYNEQQNGQYNAQPQQAQFGQRVAPKQSPAPFGQLKVQKGKFSGQLNVGEQAEADVDEQQNDDSQEDQSQVPAAKAQRGNVKYNKQAKQPEQVDAQYQQGRYVQRGSARFTGPKSQVELVKTNGKQQTEEAVRNAQNNDDEDDAESNDNAEFSGRYTQSSKSGKYTAPVQQEQQQYVPSRTFFFGRYTQPSNGQQQQAEVQSDYSKVNKFVPPKARGKSTTETPESSTTEESNDSTTEVGPTVSYNDAEAKENYTNDKESADEESTKAANGYYYLLLPDGKLQKIVYMTEEDLKKMAFVARLQYQNVEPIQGPVYSYNSENSPFVQVF